MIADIKKNRRILWLADKDSYPTEVPKRIESFINNLRQKKHITIFRSIKEEYCEMTTTDLNVILDCISQNDIHSAFPMEIKTYILILQSLSKRFRISNTGIKIFDTQLINEISRILGIPSDKELIITDTIMNDITISNNPASIIS